MNRPLAVGLRTLGIGALGGAAFAALGLPAAWLSGAMVAVAAAAIGRVEVTLPVPLRDTAFVVMGAILGATIDRDTVAGLAAWPASIAGLLVSLALLMALVPLYYQRVHRIDRATAWISAVPGALSYVVALASDLSHVDLRRVAVLQTLRVAALVALFPAAAGLFAHVVPPEAASRPELSWPVTVAVIALAGLSVPVAKAMRFPSPTFLAPMFLVGGLSVGGVIHGELPELLLWPSLVVSGCYIGLRFAGTSARFLWHCLKAGLGGLAVALTVTCGIAAVVAGLTGLPFLQLCLAYAPGALEVMPVLAFSFELDAPFVAGHQLARFLALSLVLPFLVRGGGRHVDEA